MHDVPVHNGLVHSAKSDGRALVACAVRRFKLGRCVGALSVYAKFALALEFWGKQPSAAAATPGC